MDTVVYHGASCGGYAEAKKVAGEIKDANKRTGAYGRVTYVQIEAGDFAGAWSTVADQEKSAEAVDDPYWDYDERAVREMQSKYSEIGQRLKGQFGL